MKVLVIGASGLLGKPVVEHLDKNNFQLRLFSRSIEKSFSNEKHEIVKGDVMKSADLKKAVNGCDAIHISISKVDEALAVEAIVNEAKKQHISLISYVSGCTVNEENSTFWFIDNKRRAEKIIKESDIPYLIYKPGWFFESLEMMVRGNKASVIGRKQPLSHWMSGSDFGNYVAKTYTSKNYNKSFIMYGKEEHTMKELLNQYCKSIHPNVKKVSVVPTGIFKLIGKISGKADLKFVGELFSYFEKTKEPMMDEESKENAYMLQTGFREWLSTRV